LATITYLISFRHLSVNIFVSCAHCLHR
jgi:hypothetical protein